ncbi:MAG: creatininase family protein, partial [Lentisphaeria bacterium]|nr:creatininase family protein [Lentisphaeria bacterium]
DFAGTISVRPSLFSEMIMSIAESILNTGFRRIVFLNGHGGNVVPGSAALAELIVDNDDADDAYLCLSSWWEVAQNSITQDKIESETAGVSHACEFETSLMLHVRPDLVDMTKIKPWTSPLSSKWHTIDSISNRVPIFRRFHRITDSGHTGKPETATADKGKAIYDAAVNDIKAFLTEMATWPELPVIKRS